MYHKIIKTCIILVTVQFIGKVTYAQSFAIDDIPLDWKNFEKRKNISTPYAAMTHGQYVPETKLVKRNGKKYVHFKLKANVDGSWVKSRFMAEALDSAKQRVLNHERGHLMILMIRLKRLQLAIEKFTFSKRMTFEADSIFKANIGDLKKENDLYDMETAHCLNIEQQQRWEAKLLAEINVLYAGEQKLPMELEAEAPVNN